MIRVFASGLGNRGSTPGRIIPNTQKVLLDAFLLNTQHYKVWIKGKCSNPEKYFHPPLHLDVIAIEKAAFGLVNLHIYIYIYIYIYVCI